MKYIMQLSIYFSLFYISTQITAYFTFHLFCVDDYIYNMTYSEGIIKPINPKPPGKNLTYIYYFPELMHNLNKNLCIYIYIFMM